MTTLTKYTLPTTKERLLMERQLIGRSINCIPSALTIADVLTPANFRDPLCQKLYPLILEGVDNADFGVVQITRLYQEKYKQSCGYEITNLSMIALEYPTTLELALLVLEEDIREQFLRLFTRMEHEAAKSSDFEAAAVWKQSADHLKDKTNDIFEAVDNLHAYLTACFPDQMEEYNELRSAIPKLIDRIKKRKNTRKFLNTLTRIAGPHPTNDTERTMNILKDWMVLCMGGFKLPEKFHESIEALNLTWNE